jgi:hypothetical protein
VRGRSGIPPRTGEEDQPVRPEPVEGRWGRGTCEYSKPRITKILPVFAKHKWGGGARAARDGGVTPSKGSRRDRRGPQRRGETEELTHASRRRPKVNPPRRQEVAPAVKSVAAGAICSSRYGLYGTPYPGRDGRRPWRSRPCRPNVTR